MESVYRNRNAATNSPPVEFPPDIRSGHVVLLYRENGFLLDELSQFIGGALSSGNPAIVIGTHEHRDDLADRLYRQGVDVGEITQSGGFIEVDATDALSEFLINDAPDPGRFKSLIGGLVAQAKQCAKHDRPVAIHDEMASLLWQAGQKNSAIHLEQLWNALADAYPISLCCAYSLESFPGIEDEKPFHRICAEHSAVVPGESYSQLSSVDERLRSVASLQQRSLALETEARLRRGDGQFRKMVDAVQDYAHRHSSGSAAEVQLLTKNECIVLIISENGKGMPSELLSPSHGGLSPLGMGLRGMSESVRFLGGRLEITSSGDGATITVTIPVAGCAAAMSA